ncbi:MAG TPA: class I SAM-dependent methyltransferase [Gaiellaceae bacterium]|jgi:hypothetical protein|nr:class I SAM-dependent methyltransferase [Gaiellaceae bacterium]
MRPEVAAYLARLHDVPGWFPELDFRLLDFLLDGQRPGDLLEIGAYRGASATLLGLHQREGETFTVCDLFETPATVEDNRAESEQYAGLTRSAFERWYLMFVAELPTIVQASSLEIVTHVRPRSCRLIHVDGCHLYDYVRSDIDASSILALEDGIVVFDDWRSPQTPGVTAAVLERVVVDELHPVAITPSKLYGSWNAEAATAHRGAVRAWAESAPGIELDVQSVRGLEWPRLWEATQPSAATKALFLLRNPQLLRARLARASRWPA